MTLFFEAKDLPVSGACDASATWEPHSGPGNRVPTRMAIRAMTGRMATMTASKQIVALDPKI